MPQPQPRNVHVPVLWSASHGGGRLCTCSNIKKYSKTFSSHRSPSYNAIENPGIFSREFPTVATEQIINSCELAEANKVSRQGLRARSKDAADIQRCSLADALRLLCWLDTGTLWRGAGWRCCAALCVGRRPWHARNADTVCLPGCWCFRTNRIGTWSSGLQWRPCVLRPGHRAKPLPSSQAGLWSVPVWAYVSVCVCGCGCVRACTRSMSLGTPGARSYEVPLVGHPMCTFL